FYIITGLYPGIYEVTFQCQGFAALTQKVRVFVGSHIRFDPAMAVSPVVAQEEVVEASGGVAVNTNSAQLSDPISYRQLNELPTLVRDPYSLITLSSNVTPIRINIQGIGNLTATTQPEQDFSIDGQAPTTNNVRLDGGENIVNYWSTLGQRLPLAGVQEINVITNGFRPQLDRLLGGQSPVVAAQGGAAWHGPLFCFYRSDAGGRNSCENNAFGIPKGHLVGNQPGFAVGGPIKKDKFYFYGSGEGIIQRSTQNRIAFVPTVGLAAIPAIAPFFTAFPLAPGVTDTGRVLTVGDTLGLLGLPPPPATGGAFAALGAGFPAFRQVSFNVPTDFGAGFPQDTGMAIARADYALSDRSLIYGRYAYLGRDIYRGAFSASPFAGFNTGLGEIDHNAQLNWLFPISSVGCCASPGA